MASSPTLSPCGALVAIVTVVPTSIAPPREVALGGGLMVAFTGAIALTLEKPVPKVTTCTSSPPPKWRSETVCTSLIGGRLDVTYETISCWLRCEK